MTRVNNISRSHSSFSAVPAANMLLNNSVILSLGYYRWVSLDTYLLDTRTTLGGQLIAALCLMEATKFR